MSILSSLTPFQLVLATTILAILISDDRDINEQNLIGNFLIGLGGIVIIIASSQQLSENQKGASRQISLKDQVQSLNEKILRLESLLGKPIK